MDEGEAGSGAPTRPQAAGEELKAAREAQLMSLEDVGARTRVPLRHLEAVEEGRYRDLPSTTYAVGFARAYARAVGANEVSIAKKVREELNRLGPRQPEYTPYEMADPARVPSRGIAVVALGVALGLLILGAIWFASTRFSGGDDGRAENEATGSKAVVAAVPAAPTPARPTGGQVTLTATDEVWLRVYDAGNQTLFQGTMKPGDRFDVPAGANDPKINVGRPDKLQVSLNGSNVPPLGTGERPIKDVRVSGQAIAQRLSGAPAPGATPQAAATPAAGPTASATVPPAFVSPSPTPTARTQPRRAENRRAEPRGTQPRRQLTETQRANLQSARSIAERERSNGRP